MEFHILNNKFIIIFFILSINLKAVETRVVELIKDIEVTNAIHFSRMNNKESIAEKIIQKIVNKKLNAFKLEVKSFGINPSLDFCMHLEGEVTTHKSNSGDEIATCTFKDKSYLYTWDAFKIFIL